MILRSSLIIGNGVNVSVENIDAWEEGNGRALILEDDRSQATTGALLELVGDREALLETLRTCLEVLEADNPESMIKLRWSASGEFQKLAGHINDDTPNAIIS